MIEIIKPEEIEKKSFSIITQELGDRTFPQEQAEIMKRVIHTTADFDYADHLYFSANAIQCAHDAMQQGATIITDTTMALSGINKKILQQLGCTAHCFISDPDVVANAKARGITRAIVSIERAAQLPGPLIFVIGNAPTALIRLHELVTSKSICPALVIGVPVGFVNVIESKELWIGGKTPCIIARGRKGGSNVAAAIVNALQYQLVQREGF